MPQANSADIEKHPFAPFFPEGARLLMCGTFPAQPSRWSMKFYYPNFSNDMWRVFGLVFFNDAEKFVDREHKTYRLAELQAFLASKGVALSDTGSEIVRTKGNASDKDLRIERPIDLAGVLAQLPDVTALITTGMLAAQTIAGICDAPVPAMGEYVDCRIVDADGRDRSFRHWRMPSSSRAYPMKLQLKAQYYARALTLLNTENNDS